MMGLSSILSPFRGNSTAVDITSNDIPPSTNVVEQVLAHAADLREHEIEKEGCIECGFKDGLTPRRVFSDYMRLLGRSNYTQGEYVNWLEGKLERYANHLDACQNDLELKEDEVDKISQQVEVLSQQNENLKLVLDKSSERERMAHQQLKALERLIQTLSYKVRFTEMEKKFALEAIRRYQDDTIHEVGVQYVKLDSSSGCISDAGTSRKAQVVFARTMHLCYVGQPLRALRNPLLVVINCNRSIVFLLHSAFSNVTSMKIPQRISSPEVD